jgi:LuxR family transcriptional regulator, maltose regulon positive regulatory protein
MIRPASSGKQSPDPEACTLTSERPAEDSPPLTRARSSPLDGFRRPIGGPGSANEAAVPGPYDAQVTRKKLVSWFRELGGGPVVLVTASAGYGKTTLLQQWADSQTRPVAWLTLDDAENDAVVLLGYVAAALGSSEPLDSGLFSGPLSDPSFFEQVVLSRFGEAINNRKTPFLLIVDDVHTVSAPRSWLALSTIISCLPEGSLLVLSGRNEPPPILARATGRRPIARISQADLAFDPAEGATLLRAMGLELAPEHEAALVAKTEGWPATLYLAGLSLQDHPDPATAVATFSGSSGVVADYLRDEFLARTSPELTKFLTRTAILGDVTGPLCDAVLGDAGGAETLTSISSSNLLLKPTDPERGWYRYHQLFGDLLRAELRRVEPELEPELHARASAWCEQNGFMSAAISHARAAGDVARAAELVWSETPRLLTTGRRGTIERWLEGFDSPQLVADPLLALTAAWCALPSGDPVEPWLLTAELALRNADRHAASGLSVPGAVALLRGILAQRGARRMAADAELAHDLDSPDSPGRAAACYLAGAAHHLLGNADQAKTWLQTGLRIGRTLPLPAIWALCAAQLALDEVLEGDRPHGAELVEEAMGAVRTVAVQDYASMAPVFAIGALTLAHDRRAAEAQAAAEHARGLLSRISHLAPWAAVEVRVVLARTHLLLGDLATMSTLLAEADEQLPEIPDAPVLLQHLDEVRSLARISTINGQPHSPTLTVAEQRVMRLLSTHLSFEEIAKHLFISKNTVKTQAISAYRKLGVHSRSAAVEKIRDMGLNGQTSV